MGDDHVRTGSDNLGRDKWRSDSPALRSPPSPTRQMMTPGTVGRDVDSDPKSRHLP